MRLFSKIAITTAAAVIVSTVASAAAVAYVFVPQYIEMDRSAALSNAERVHDFLQHELDTTSSYVSDWGHWDETFVFAKKFDNGYIERNLKEDDLQTIHVDEFAIARPDGTITFEQRAKREPDAAAVPFTGMKSIPAAQWHDFAGEVTRETRAGFAATAAGPAMIAETVITDSSGNGPSPGVIVFARLVDAAFLKAASEQTNLQFELAPASAAPPSATLNESIGRIRPAPAALVKRDGRIAVSTVLHDVSGAPSFTLRVVTPTHYEQLIATTMWAMLAILFVVGGFGGFVMFAFMQRVVTGPLQRIVNHTGAIAQTGDLDTALNLARNDEIGALANAFDAMIRDLYKARHELQEQSYVSGMASIAAEMMHNIRNSLSPVSTALWKGRESLNDVHTDRLAEAGHALSEPATEPDRRSKLAQYVSVSAEHISERCRNATAEFEAIARYTDQIELVLKHHEELSRGMRQIDDVDVAELVDGAAHMARQAKYAHVEIVIAPAIAELPLVAAQRVVLLQVLGNLVFNALQSIERAQAVPGRIAFDGSDAGDHVELTVTDNGEGISAARMPNLFKRGFTSRGGKGTGLGLHYAATSLGAANASIAVESEGPGKGATFRIRLPVGTRKERAA